ncbi:MAG TPA: indole-3-glycerol-phosphate synthase [Methylomirabilota bacterium]|nr:indole-3-glycerol-phosphate synthase [Methylomirabilota bacterium]
MTDFLDKLIQDAEERIMRGYYDQNFAVQHEHLSLSHAIKSSNHNAIIAEIKPKSPSRGTLRAELDPKVAAIQLARGGATGLSVLTEPDNFGGTLQTLAQIRPAVDIPLLMKDIIIGEEQIKAAGNSGADCILLILSSLARKGIPAADLINKAHKSRLEVILEVHTAQEMEHASQTDAEIIGINNRNLSDLVVDLNTTTKLLDSAQIPDKTIISESGFETTQDIRRFKDTHIDGFLIGSSIMRAPNLEEKVREFVYA